jgi:hypothetical protein
LTSATIAFLSSSPIATGITPGLVKVQWFLLQRAGTTSICVSLGRSPD